MLVYSYSVWIAVVLTKVIALVACYTQRPYRPLLSIRAYLAFSALMDVVQFATLQHFGLASAQYKAVYYWTDLTLDVAGYLVLVRLLELAFENSALKLPRLRSTALLVFSGVAVITAFLVLEQRATLIDASDEFEQNLSFLGAVLTFALWIVLNVVRVPGVRFRRLVLAFGVLYSSGAVVYALHFVFAGLVFWKYLIPLCGLLGAGLLAYTLLNPEPEVLSLSRTWEPV